MGIPLIVIVVASVGFFVFLKPAETTHPHRGDVLDGSGLTRVPLYAALQEGQLLTPDYGPELRVGDYVLIVTQPMNDPAWPASEWNVEYPLRVWAVDPGAGVWVGGCPCNNPDGQTREYLSYRQIGLLAAEAVLGTTWRRQEVCVWRR
jgi:hypothetical protein